MMNRAAPDDWYNEMVDLAARRAQVLDRTQPQPPTAPVAFSCFSHLVIRGFYRRPFDLFAIVRLALRS